jgi:hypothetical protein
VGAGQVECLADEVDQQQARLDLGAALLAVDAHADGYPIGCCRHATASSQRSTARRSARLVSSRTMARL